MAFKKPIKRDTDDGSGFPDIYNDTEFDEAEDIALVKGVAFGDENTYMEKADESGNIKIKYPGGEKVIADENSIQDNSVIMAIALG